MRRRPAVDGSSPAGRRAAARRARMKRPSSLPWRVDGDTPASMAAGLDLADPSTVDIALAAIGPVDAVICAGAHAPLTPAPQVSAEIYRAASRAKLVGQIHLVHAALRHVRPGGSITVTTGQFDHGTPGAAVGASVNTALETFVRLAAPEIPRGIRLNVVSPGWASETLSAMGEPPTNGTPVGLIAQMYQSVVIGTANGSVVVDAPA